MARPGSRRGRDQSTSQTWLLVGLAVAGTCSLGYGLWMASGRPTSVTPVVEPISQPATGAPPGPTAPAMIVKPGTVDLTREAPTDTRPPARDGVICPGCDIVLITVCSLRKDFVSRFGAPPGLTPGIDRISDGGYAFGRAYAASNFTLAGLTAVLTGRFGSTTGVTGWDRGLTAEVPTLPEVLGFYGYATAGFTIDAPSGFRPDYGLDRGFQHMKVISPPRDTPDGRFGDGEPGSGGASAQPVVDWLGGQSTDAPMFLMFHSRTAHFPFVISPDPEGADPTGVWQGLWDAGRVAREAPAGQAMPGMAGGTSQEGVVQIRGPDPLLLLVQDKGQPAVDSWRQRYAESVRRMDIDVERVWQALEQRGKLDRTIVVLVGDHGESLYDHHELLHGDAYWNTVVNVPLVMRVPGLDGNPEIHQQLVSHVDLLPTLLELVGAVTPADIDGRSMVPLLTGESDKVRDMALVEGGVAKHDESVLRGAVVAPPYMLVRQDRGCDGPPGRDPPRRPGEPATCLYDMDKDPLQLTNVALQNKPLVDALMGRWQSFRDARAKEAVQLDLDPAFVAELRANGYNFE